MPKTDPSGLTERELPEWLQREVDEINRRTARDRLRIAAFALLVPVAFLSVACLILAN